MMSSPTVGNIGQSVSSTQPGNSQIDQKSKEQQAQGFFGRLGQCVRVVTDALTYIPRTTMGLIWGSTQPAVETKNERAAQPAVETKNERAAQPAVENQNEPVAQPAVENQNEPVAQPANEKLNESYIPEDFGNSFDRVCRYGSIHPSLSLDREHYVEGENSPEYRLALSKTNYLNRKKFAATENKKIILYWNKYKADCKSLKDRLITVLKTVYKKIVSLEVRTAFRKLSDKISTSDYNLFKTMVAAKDLKDAKEALRRRTPVMGPLYSAVVQRARKVQEAEPVEGKTPYERIANKACVGEDKALDYNNPAALRAAIASGKAAIASAKQKTDIQRLEEKLQSKNACQLKEMYIEMTTDEDKEAHEANRKNNENVNFLIQGGKTTFFYDLDPQKNNNTDLLVRNKAKMDKKLEALR